MVSYIIKRLLAAVATLLIIMAITFVLMNAIPGNPFLSEKATPQAIELAFKKYGLDKPLIVQFKNYVVNYLHGDLGVSLKMQELRDGGGTCGKGKLPAPGKIHPGPLRNPLRRPSARSGPDTDEDRCRG